MGLREKWNAVMPLESCVCKGNGEAKDERPSTVLLPFSCHSGKGEHTWNQFVVRILGKGERDNYRTRLEKQGIQSEIYYPRSMHEQGCFLKHKIYGEYPMAERLAAESLALPLGFIPGQ
jgi:dTDP-4-amino-4,6-dideoxygalactose transaminase